MSTLLEVKDLKKYFKTKKGLLHAVDDVNFTINQGETLGVVGESGCGKSTLGRVIVHLLDNTDGQIFFEGKDVTNLNKKELFDYRSDVQMIFQDPYSSLNPRMSIGQIIAEPLVIEGKLNKAEIEKEVYDMMDTVGLARRLYNAYPHELDGGRRQRVGVARALILKPKFVVCDEPVSALDVSIQAQILNLLLELQEKLNLTYIFITHDLSVVKYISNEIMVMYLGQVVEKSATKELFEFPLHPYTKALLSAVLVPDVHAPMERIPLIGELTSPINPKPGCRFASRCVYAKDKCRQENPKLVEVRPGHVTACHYIHEINPEL